MVFTLASVVVLVHSGSSRFLAGAVTVDRHLAVSEFRDPSSVLNPLLHPTCSDASSSGEGPPCSRFPARPLETQGSLSCRAAMGIGHVVATDSPGACPTRPPNSTGRSGGLVQPGAWGRIRSHWRREAPTQADRGPRRTAAAERVPGATQHRRAHASP